MSRECAFDVTHTHQSFFFWIAHATKDIYIYIYPKEETLPPARFWSVDEEEEETTPHVVRVFARPILWWRVLAADRDSAAPGKLFYARER